MGREVTFSTEYGGRSAHFAQERNGRHPPILGSCARGRVEKSKPQPQRAGALACARVSVARRCRSGSATPAAERASGRQGVAGPQSPIISYRGYVPELGQEGSRMLGVGNGLGRFGDE